MFDSQIRKLSEFEHGHNSVEPTKKICSMKGEGTVDHSMVMVQEMLLKIQELGWSGKIRNT